MAAIQQQRSVKPATPARRIVSAARPALPPRGNWLQRAGCHGLRLSLAIIFIWFGLLKVFEYCPLGDFVCRTLPFLPPTLCLRALGSWEVIIGVCLLFRGTLRLGVLMLLAHMVGTALPFVLLPDECFTHFPLALTVNGQYILKNLTLVSAALVIAGNTPATRFRCLPSRA
jgi:uncharacterized membrane protein YkgB